MKMMKRVRFLKTYKILREGLIKIIKALIKRLKSLRKKILRKKLH
jgi:hypothetical protein